MQESKPEVVFGGNGWVKLFWCLHCREKMEHKVIRVEKVCVLMPGATL